MSILGNIIWLIFGGFIGGLLWIISGTIYCITIIGIPFGLQCFKLASLTFMPFDRVVEYGDNGVFGCFGNLIWFLFTGLELALYHLVMALILSITIIGIPFAMQHLKLAKLSLYPFGSSIK